MSGFVGLCTDKKNKQVKLRCRTDPGSRCPLILVAMLNLANSTFILNAQDERSVEPFLRRAVDGVKHNEIRPAEGCCGLMVCVYYF